MSTQESDYWRLSERLDTALVQVSSLLAEIEALTMERGLIVDQGKYAIDAARAEVEDRDREIEVLTTERDNALLRIEELERELDWARPFVEIERPDDKGGVNPNA